MSGLNEQAVAEFRRKLEHLGGSFQESARRAVNQQAAAGLRKTVEETPVGNYGSQVYFETQWGKPVSFKTHKTRVGGTLKRNWKLNRARKLKNGAIAGYSNNTAYAVFVNTGHRQVNRWGETTGWVEGNFMLEKGIAEAERQLPKIFNAEVARVKRETGF